MPSSRVFNVGRNYTCWGWHRWRLDSPYSWKVFTWMKPPSAIPHSAPGPPPEVCPARSLLRLPISASSQTQNSLIKGESKIFWGKTTQSHQLYPFWLLGGCGMADHECAFHSPVLALGSPSPAQPLGRSSFPVTLRVSEARHLPPYHDPEKQESGVARCPRAFRVCLIDSVSQTP